MSDSINLNVIIPPNELIFLNENISLCNHFLQLLLNAKQNNKDKPTIILCKNSYERRFVHVLAKGLGLYHARHGDWDEWFKKYRDWQENVDSIDGQEHYKIVGVKVSTKPLHLTRKDVRHQFPLPPLPSLLPLHAKLT